MQMLSLQYRLLFSHLTEHVTFWRVDCRLRSLKHLPSQVLGFWGWWQHKSTSHWGLGLHFVGQWTTVVAATPCHSNLAPPYPRFPYTFCRISKQRSGTPLKALGCFCVALTWNAPTVFLHTLSESPQNPCYEMMSSHVCACIFMSIT